METIKMDSLEVETLRSEIQKVNQEWMDCVGKKDPDAASACYTEDAMIMPPNTLALSGRAGVRDFISVALNSGITAVNLTSEDVYGAQDLAIETGKYEMMVDDKLVDVGKYVVGWRKVGDQWFIHRDIFNSNLPAQNAPAAGTSVEAID